eukprot:6458446-Amphidinium_carterae.2
MLSKCRHKRSPLFQKVLSGSSTGSASVCSMAARTSPIVTSKSVARKKREEQALNWIPDVSELASAKPTAVTVQAVRAAVGPERGRWKEALQAELASLQEHRVFYKVDSQSSVDAARMAGATVVPARVVLVLKPDPGNGDGFKRKARIVACGNFAQEYEHFEVANLEAAVFRAVLNVAACRKLRLGILDIKTAFLHASIQSGRTVLVTPPRILIDYQLCEPGETWALSRALYGLKESPGLWAEHRDQAISAAEVELPGIGRCRWLQSVVHPSVWFLVHHQDHERVMEHRRGRKGCVGDLAAMACDGVPSLDDFAIPETWYAIMTVYVDDLMVAASDDYHGFVIESLQRIWQTSTPQVLGLNADSFTYLGVVVSLAPDGMGFIVHQVPYLADLLDKYSDLVPVKSKVTTAPTDESSVGGEVSDDMVSRLRAVLGALLWLATRSRPDISWAHSMASTAVSSNPCDCEKRVVHLLGYLRDSADLGIRVCPESEQLDVYTEISFAPSGSRSHSGTVAKIGNSLLTWRSHRQSLTALSTAEAELYAAVEGLSVLRSSRMVLREMGLTIRNACIHCDNTASVLIANGNPPMRSRHWSMRAWMLNEAISAGELAMVYIDTKQQQADTLTKGVGSDLLKRHRNLLGLVRC